MINPSDLFNLRPARRATSLYALFVTAAAILVTPSSTLFAQDHDNTPPTGATQRQVHIGTFRTRGDDPQKPPAQPGATPADGSLDADSSPATDRSVANDPAHKQKRRTLLAGALKHLNAKRIQFARRQLELLVARYPDSPEADTARGHLGRLYARATPNQPPAAGDARPQAKTARVPTKQPHPGQPGQTRQTSRPPAINEYLSQAMGLAVGDRVFFPEDSDRLGSKAGVVLKRQAQWLHRRAGLTILISGHADESGGEDHNRAISKRRAIAVRERLIEEGVARHRIQIIAVGHDNPIATCDTPACATQNRRVITSVLQGSSLRVRAKPRQRLQ